MKLTEEYNQKIDPLLRQALQQAREDKNLRVIMVLGSAAGESNGHREEQDLDPSQFASIKEYRQALVDRQKERIIQEVGETQSRLRELPLSVCGGTHSHSIVVEGPASAILRSLGLPGVLHASLDQPMALIEPPLLQDEDPLIDDLDLVALMQDRMTAQLQPGGGAFTSARSFRSIISQLDNLEARLSELRSALHEMQTSFSGPLYQGAASIAKNNALKITFYPPKNQANLEYNNNGQTYTVRIRRQLYWLLRHVVLSTLNYIDLETDSFSRKHFHWSWAFYLFDLPEVTPESGLRVRAGFVRQVHQLNVLIAKLVSGNARNREAYTLRAEAFGPHANGFYSTCLGTPQLPMGETNIEQVDILIGDNAMKDTAWRNSEIQRCLRAITNIRKIFLEQPIISSDDAKDQAFAANQTIKQIQQMYDRLQVAVAADSWIADIFELVNQVQRLDSHEAIDKDQNVAIAPSVLELAKALNQAVIAPLVKQVNLSPSEWREYGYEALYRAAKAAQPRWGTRKQVQEYFYFALLIYLATAQEANEEIVNRAILAFGKQIFGEQMKESYRASIYAWMLAPATERASVLRSADLVRSLKKDWNLHRSLYSEG